MGILMLRGRLSRVHEVPRPQALATGRVGQFLIGRHKDSGRVPAKRGKITSFDTENLEGIREIERGLLNDPLGFCIDGMPREI